eukprot:3763366-Prymnesium_polylepis.1
MWHTATVEAWPCAPGLAWRTTVSEGRGVARTREPPALPQPHARAVWETPLSDATPAPPRAGPSGEERSHVDRGGGADARLSGGRGARGCCGGSSGCRGEPARARVVGDARGSREPAEW